MAKRALCVGINNFKNYPDNSLNGCINDAYYMGDMLREHMGFEAEEIVKLVDKDATKSQIMENLKEMVERSKQGKYDGLVFAMSTHGSKMKDESLEGPDKFHEVFCPYDLDVAGKAWDPSRIITDEELHDLFVQVPEDVVLEVYLDTSHSEDIVKEIEPIPDREPKYIPFPPAEDAAPVEVREFKEPLLSSRHILWTACKSDETCVDTNINGEWHGAFTYYLFQEVYASENKLSRGEILKKVVEDLKAHGYAQTPQLECDVNNRNGKLKWISVPFYRL